MLRAICLVVGRFLVAVVAFSLASLLAHRVTGTDTLSKRARRLARYLENALRVLLIGGLAAEVVGYFGIAESGSRSAGSIVRVFALSGWALIPWLVTIAILAFGCTYFLLVHWPGYLTVHRELVGISADPERAGSLKRLREIHDNLGQLMPFFPVGLDLLCRADQDRVIRLMSAPPDTWALREAADRLQNGDSAAALAQLLGVEGMQMEKVLVAAESGEWKECSKLLGGLPPNSVRTELAQMMAEPESAPYYQELGLSLITGPKSRRRRALLAFRYRDAGKARMILSDDWEARNWFRDNESEEQER